jgi:phospholipid/cholesterol/gamma-HCH transport system substrate-binding protein
MSKPFKFRYVNQIAGVFVLLVLFLVVAGVLATGRAQGWFKPMVRVQLALPEGDVEGLQAGAEVTILGTKVGAVDHIEPEADGRMVAWLKIRGDYFRQYVRRDSQAMIKRKFGLGGDAFISITRGRGAEMDEKNAALVAKVDTELAQLLQEGFEEAKAKTLETLDLVQAVLLEAIGLAGDLRAPEGHLQRILADLNRITAGLAAGEGPAGLLLRDPGYAEQIKVLTTEINRSLEGMNAILVHAQESLAGVPGLVDNLTDTTAGLPALVEKADLTLAGMPKLVGTVGGRADEVFDLLQRADQTLREVERTLRGLQRHWVLRKYVEPEPSDGGGWLPPAELRRLEENAP